MGKLRGCGISFQRYVQVHPDVKVRTRWAKFEFSSGDEKRAREVYEAAVEFLRNEPEVGELYANFAKFEEMCREVERARAIYKFALDNLPKEQAESVYKEFMKFEKMHGDREGIEDVVVGQRRFKYEEEISKIRSVTTRGSITSDWRRARVTWPRRERCTNAPSLTYLPRTRNGSGSDTFTCGSTTHYTKSSRREMSSARVRCIGHA